MTKRRNQRKTGFRRGTHPQTTPPADARIRKEERKEQEEPEVVMNTSFEVDLSLARKRDSLTGKP